MQYLIVTIAFLTAGAVLGWMMFQEWGSSGSVTPEQVVDLLKSDSSVVILDVRTEAEYQSETGYLKNATLIPVQELSGRLGELEPFKGRTVVVYCRTDNRSRLATALLKEAGHDTLFMVGGVVRWNREGLPVERFDR
ncbi:MAG: rhodanese-like domain-containing protein [Ignavibacteriales bacterium]|nr:rhodanese-like domain-containing protein [Ignavibacteriales bacterium]